MQSYIASKMAWKDFPLTRFGLAQMLLIQGKEDQALKELQKVLSKFPNNFETLKLSVMLLQKKGDIGTALELVKVCVN